MRKDLTQRMRLIQRFRNRVAHHDCLLDSQVEARTLDMFAIAGWNDGDSRSWIESQTSVVEIIEQRPPGGAD